MEDSVASIYLIHCIDAIILIHCCMYNYFFSESFIFWRVLTSICRAGNARIIPWKINFPEILH